MPIYFHVQNQISTLWISVPAGFFLDATYQNSALLLLDNGVINLEYYIKKILVYLQKLFFPGKMLQSEISFF